MRLVWPPASGTGSDSAGPSCCSSARRASSITAAQACRKWPAAVPSRSDAGSLTCRRGGLRARADGDDPRGDRRAPRHGDPPRPARAGRPPAAGARPRRPARHRPLDAAPGAHVADRERPPDRDCAGAAAARSSRTRRRWPRARGSSSPAVTGATCSTTGSPSRSAPCVLAAERRRRRTSRALREHVEAMRDGRPTSRTTGAPTCSSISASPRRRGRRGCSRR